MVGETRGLTGWPTVPADQYLNKQSKAASYSSKQACGCGIATCLAQELASLARPGLQNRPHPHPLSALRMTMRLDDRRDVPCAAGDIAAFSGVFPSTVMTMTGRTGLNWVRMRLFLKTYANPGGCVCRPAWGFIRGRIYPGEGISCRVVSLPWRCRYPVCWVVAAGPVRSGVKTTTTRQQLPSEAVGCPDRLLAERMKVYSAFGTAANKSYHVPLLQVNKGKKNTPKKNQRRA